MKCKNCGEKPRSPPLVRYWKEYRVGGFDSSERFHVCPECDDETDPIELWASDAEVIEVSP